MCSSAAVLFLYGLILRPQFPYLDAVLGDGLVADLLAEREFVLSAAQINEYESEHVLLVRNVVPSKVLERLRQVLVQAEREITPSPLYDQSVLFTLNYAWAHSQACADFSFSGLTASLAKQLLPNASAVHLVNSHVFGLSRQGTMQAKDWHRDVIGFRPVNTSSNSGLSIWIPLQPIDDDNHGGGLQYVTSGNSTSDDRRKHNTSTVHSMCPPHAVDDLSGRTTATPAGEQCRSWLHGQRKGVGRMGAGDVLIFDAHTFHSTSPLHDNAPSSRIAYTERFVGGDAGFDAVSNELWAHDYIAQPLCAFGLQHGEVQ
jgi:hypothetical protein